MTARTPQAGTLPDAGGMTMQDDGGAVVPALALLNTVAVALLGASVALACGCGADSLAALGTAALALWGHLTVRWQRMARDDPSERRRDMADVAAMLLIGGGLLAATRSGPALLGVGALALLLGSWIGRATPAPGRPSHALGAAACLWLVVIGVDQAHRHSLSAMAAVLGGGPALLVAAARLQPLRARWSGSATLLALTGQAWTAAWWAAGWLPTSAWWALVSLPLGLAGLLAVGLGQARLGAGLAWAASLCHAGLLTAALWGVVSLR